MPMPPDAWQEKLERHFTQIAETRRVSEFPIFALEHGLEKHEVAEIGDYLRIRVARGLPLHPHWLLWVIYATELGYLYDGHDYWPPFEEQTPHWRQNGDSRQLKEWFKKFQKRFNGVTPSGPWAIQFNRIAWPITHAVLPKLLQVQFASALFELSREVARTANLDAVTAGSMLSNYAWSYSSRFQEFLQQEELAGRIMLALLGKSPSGSPGSPIYPPTLERIIADVEEVQSAGAYLKEARRIVSDRFHGVDRTPVGPIRGENNAFGRDRPTDEPLSLQPVLTLRRSSNSAWAVVLEIPSFAGVAKLSSELTQFLKTSRCSVAGVGATMFPPGWLLYGPQVRSVKTWPAANEPPIKFESVNPTIENLMRGECRFSSGPTWLFRVGSDGLAREVPSRVARAGERYIVASREEPTSTLLAGTPVDIACEGIKGLSIGLPDFISPELTAELERLGVWVSRNVRIWPVGLCIRNWDGEGHGDWLTTEIPCFGISHDHAVDDYFVKLNHSPEVRIEGARARQPVFIRLPGLAPGQHTLAVRARRIGVAATGKALQDLQGRIELKVRDPSHWKPGVALHSGLTVSTDPHDPSLDSFWEGNVGISVNGPEGHSVACAISLVGKNRETVLSEEIGKFDLPLRSGQWFHRFRHFANDDARAWKFLEASSGQFTIKGEELGQYNLRLERDLKPVRWICRTSSHSTDVRLVDDTDSDEVGVVEFLSFLQPTLIQHIEASDSHAGLTVSEPGGLYFARQGEHRDTLVVSSSRHANALSDLQVQPKLPSIGSSASDLVRLLAVTQLWHEARLVGTLAINRREHIVRCLMRQLYTSLCGEHWARAEDTYLSNPHASGNLDRLKMAVGGHRSLGVVLVSHPEKLEGGIDLASDWFCEVSDRYGACKDQNLIKFALKLASRPLSVVSEYAAGTESLLKEVALLPHLVRSARLLSIMATAANTNSSSTARSM